MRSRLIPFIILFVGCFYAFQSCSSDYDYTIDLNTNNLAFITLKSNFDHTTVGLDQNLSFSVFDDINGEEYTSIANFFINGVAFTGNNYSFTEEGTYIFTATVENIESNALTIDVVGNRFVTVDKSKVLRGQEAVFNFFDTNGDDITSTATFLVNGTIVSGNTFTSNQEGIYQVVAQYSGSSISEPTSFEVFIPKRKVSFEDYTGTWCGWCPRVTSAINILNEASDDVVSIAIHNNDDMVHSEAQELQLREAFNVTGFPAARLNRIHVVKQLNEDQPEVINEVLSIAGSNTDLSIAIDTKLSGSLLNVKVLLLSENGLPSDYKLVTYIYQNGLIFPQTNYYVGIEGSPWFGLGNPIPDFVHDHVLEVSLTDIFGNPITQTGPLEEYVTSFDPVRLSDYGHTEGQNTFDPARFGVAVYLVNANNETLNAQHVKAGESVGFE